MKIEIIRGTVNHGNKEFKVGEIADLPDIDAKRLIALGVAKEPGKKAAAFSGSEGAGPEQTKSGEESVKK
jgi:hypothetical protein